MATIEKKNWVSRVLGVLNMTEDGHVAAFHKLATDSFKKAIKELKKRSDRLTEDSLDWLERENEILSELKEKLTEVAVTVDKDMLTTRENRESYFQTYVYAVKKARELVATQEVKIKKYTESIESEIKKINDDIAEQKGMLEFLAD